MSRKRPHEIESELDDLKRDHGETDVPTDVTVDWRVPDDPAPDADGIRFDAESETLTYDLWSAQQECLDALMNGPYDIVGFLAGYGTGKTILGARWVLMLALRYPDSRFLAMGQTYSKASNATFRKLFEQLPGRNTGRDPERSPIVADYTASKRRLTFTNGSEIVLGSADSWNRYAGVEFGGIWLDEPSHYKTDLHDLLEMLGGRLRGVPGPKRQCWTLTGNGYNDAWEILEQRRDSTGEPIGLEIELVRASTLDNPYLTADEHSRLERQYGGTSRAEQALHGGFAAAQGLVYSQFDRNTHVLPHVAAIDRVDETDEWRIYGYDAGWNNPRVLLEVGKTPYDQLVVFDEYYESESRVDDAIDWLTEKPRGMIYSEHAPEDICQFRRAGYPATRAKKSLDPGIEEVRRRLESDRTASIAVPDSSPTVIRGSPSELAERRRNSAQWEEIQRGRHQSSSSATERNRETETTSEGRVGLLVSERCKHLIQEFHSYKTDHVGESGAPDDCLDALRYACQGVAGP